MQPSGRCAKFARKGSVSGEAGRNKAKPLHFLEAAAFAAGNACTIYGGHRVSFSRFCSRPCYISACSLVCHPPPNPVPSPPEMRTQYEEKDVRRVIEQMAARIASAFTPDQPLSIIGVRTRGETLAQRLTSLLEGKHKFTQIGRGTLDITLYRDDLSEIGPRPLVRPTDINFDVGGKPLLLVDDVLFTGRSVRAALDALADFGRPRVIRLAVLVDRGGRELPIAPDFVGLTLKDIPADHRVNVRFTENDAADEIVVEPKG